MRTLLVLTNHANFASALHAALDPARFQIIAKANAAEASLLLNRGAIDATILDAELPGPRAIPAIEELRAQAPGCPVILYTGEKPCSWEEDAYVLGVAHVLAKPVRGRLLAAVLDKIFPDLGPPTAPSAAASEPVARAAAASPMRGLESLRRVAAILSHGLDGPELLRQFLLLLREVMGVNRAVIFLRKPASRPGEGTVSLDDRWLRSACAIGLDQALLQHAVLSLNTGIGAVLHRSGRVLRATSPEATTTREIAKEFQLLGAQLAIPILDRESLLGVALLDERVTGEPFSNEEIALIFHLFEEIGLALRNSWYHDQIVTSHNLVGDILAHLGSGAIVFGANCEMVHVNGPARAIFLPGAPPRASFDFADLPQQLGSMVFTVVQGGEPVAPLKYSLPQAPERIFEIEITPFRAVGDAAARAALMLIHDVTEHEHAQRLELEAANLRLIKAMAEHLAHEIGNAVVPISTHQQLLKDQINDPEFQESLTGALASGVRRISRLASQMVFLAREWNGDFSQLVSIGDLIVEAFHEAHTYHPGKKVAQLSFNKKAALWKVKADPKALRHAFSEIMLNALQANPENPTVAVDLEESKGQPPRLTVEVRDSGKGFTIETAEHASEPFFSTRNVGLGIGLTVTRRIIESHNGQIEIPPSEEGQPGVVRISLPLDPPPPKAITAGDS
ncbi:MAG: ATP-binding protein [Chthoniobacteraceae bacterium]